jgi:flagellar biogenesis protein FliO
MHVDFLTLLLQSFSALAAVLALFAMLIWMLKRLQQHRLMRTPDGQAHITQRFAIDAKHSVVELTRGETCYLIGLSPTGMTAIAEYKTPVEEKEEETSSP